MNEDKTALSYWFPKLEAAGLPVPKTILIDMPEDAQKYVWGLFDGKEGGDTRSIDAFVAELATACSSVGYPAFLRTDHTSGKHNWKKACFVPDGNDLGSHVFRYCRVFGDGRDFRPAMVPMGSA
jgi:hypothetical protein